MISAPLVSKPVVQRKDSCSSYSATGSSSSESQSSDSDSEASHKSSSSQSYKSEQQQGRQDEKVETSVSRRSVLGLRSRPPKRRVCIQSSGSEEEEVSDKQSNDGSDYVVSQSEKSEDELEEESVSASESGESIWSDEYLPKKRTTTRRTKKKPAKVNSIPLFVTCICNMGTRYGILTLTHTGFGDHLGQESFPVVMQQTMTQTVNMVAPERAIEGICMVPTAPST